MQNNSTENVNHDVVDKHGLTSYQSSFIRKVMTEDIIPPGWSIKELAGPAAEGTVEFLKHDSFFNGLGQIHQMQCGTILTEDEKGRHICLAMNSDGTLRLDYGPNKQKFMGEWLYQEWIYIPF